MSHSRRSAPLFRPHVLAALAVLGFGAALAAPPLKLCDAVENPATTDFLVGLGPARDARLRLVNDQFLFVPRVPSAADVALARGFVGFLRTHGVRVVLLNLPPPGALYTTPDVKLWLAARGSSYDPARAEGAYRAWLDAANAAGFSTVDLLSVARKLEASGRPFYALRDHHWSGEGVRAGAEAAAARVEALGVKLARSAPVEVKTRTVPSAGSFAGFLKQKCGIELPAEHRLTFDVSSSVGLLDDVKYRVVVVGDSHAVDAFGFPQLLGAALRTPVLGAALSGGGPVSGFAALFENLGKAPPPEVIVWTAFQLDLRGPAVREYWASARQALAPGRAVASASGALGKGALDLRLSSAGARDADLALRIVGDRSEIVPVLLTFTDGTREEYTFSHRTPEVKTAWDRRYFLRLPSGKVLRGVTVRSITTSDGSPANAARTFAVTATVLAN